jgi:hypothetical protein
MSRGVDLSDNQRRRSHLVLGLVWSITWMQRSMGVCRFDLSKENRKFWGGAFSWCKRMPFNVFYGSMTRSLTGYPESHLVRSIEICISYRSSMQIDFRLQKWIKWSKSCTLQCQFSSWMFPVCHLWTRSPHYDGDTPKRTVIGSP